MCSNDAEKYLLKFDYEIIHSFIQQKKIFTNTNMEPLTLDDATLKDGFAKDRRYLKGFLAKIQLVFMLYPDRFQNDDSKIAYVVSRLYGEAMNWAASLIDNNDPCLSDYAAFVERIKITFKGLYTIFLANQRLRTIHQKKLDCVLFYILEFNKFSDESSWNEQAKMDAFLNGFLDLLLLKF